MNNNYHFSGEIFGQSLTLRRVTQQTAIKIFLSGTAVYLQSSNFAPFGYWQQAYQLSPGTPPEKSDFVKTCNEFIYYNCDNERGKYIHFYATPDAVNSLYLPEEYKLLNAEVKKLNETANLFVDAHLLLDGSRQRKYSLYLVCNLSGKILKALANGENKAGILTAVSLLSKISQ